MSLKKAAQLIGYVPQNHAPVYDYSVRDFIVMGRAPHLGMLEKPSENDYASWMKLYGNWELKSLLIKHIHRSAAENDSRH